jgi:hypothetical protein
VIEKADNILDIILSHPTLQLFKIFFYPKVMKEIILSHELVNSLTDDLGDEKGTIFILFSST